MSQVGEGKNARDKALVPRARPEFMRADLVWIQLSALLNALCRNPVGKGYAVGYWSLVGRLASRRQAASRNLQLPALLEHLQ
jgi:hypothetical protein